MAKVGCPQTNTERRCRTAAWDLREREFRLKGIGRSLRIPSRSTLGNTTFDLVCFATTQRSNCIKRSTHGRWNTSLSKRQLTMSTNARSRCASFVGHCLKRTTESCLEFCLTISGRMVAMAAVCLEPFHIWGSWRTIDLSLLGGCLMWAFLKQSHRSPSMFFLARGSLGALHAQKSFIRPHDWGDN